MLLSSWDEGMCYLALHLSTSRDFCPFFDLLRSTLKRDAKCALKKRQLDSASCRKVWKVAYFSDWTF